MIDAERFFAVNMASTTVLDSDELVTDLEIPIPPEESIQVYRKFRIRRSIDFAIVSVASVLSCATARFGRLRLYSAPWLLSRFELRTWSVFSSGENRIPRQRRQPG